MILMVTQSLGCYPTDCSKPYELRRVSSASADGSGRFPGARSSRACTSQCAPQSFDVRDPVADAVLRGSFEHGNNRSGTVQALW